MEQLSLEQFRIDPDDWPSLLSQVNAETRGGYAAFRKTLTPHHSVVWRDLALGYLALAGVLAAVAAIPGIVGGILAACFGAAFVGFVISYIQLFIHEAAHWHIAPTREANDRIANALIAWQVGTSIAAYRKVHFEHHRQLGRDGDEELSYLYPLNSKLLFEMITGIHAVRVFLARSKAPKVATEAASKAPLLRGAMIHFVLLGTLIALGYWQAALAWCGGMAVFFPLFATLRPLLEHRPSASDSRILATDRKSVTRVFDNGVFARIFGGAGFNRHLLHHWEPQVSYTRLAELDAYLSKTSVGSIVDERRTTYAKAFRAILASDRAS